MVNVFSPEVLGLRANQVFNTIDESAASNLNIFFEYIEAIPRLNSVIQNIIGDGLQSYDEIQQELLGTGQIIFPDVNMEKLRICLITLNAVRNREVDAWHIGMTGTRVQNVDACTQRYMGLFFQPVYNQILETIATQNEILYNLVRFKAQNEWYSGNVLYELYHTDTAHGEYNLDLKLREFLFQSGIDYPFSTPESPDGRTDILTVIDNVPIPIEVKLYTGDRNRIRQGFRQAITYAQNYLSESCYLVIYNLTEFELMFEDNKLHEPINHLGKNVYIVVVNLFPHTESASKRKVTFRDIEINYLIS